MPCKELVSKTDALSLKRDIAFRDATNLEDKTESDREMFAGLYEVSTSGVGDWLANCIAVAAV